MLKTTIILFNFVALSLLSYFFAGEVKVVTNLPAEVIQDSAYLIEVTIDRGEIAGYAKFQQNLPVGFDVQPVETSEATFSYADGKIKFIWMAIPEKSQIKLSYTLKATAQAPVLSFSEAKFSYIENSERKDFDLPNQSIKVIKREDIPVEVPAMAEIIREVKSLGGDEYQVNLQISKQGISGFSKIEEYLPANTAATVISNELAVFSQVDDKAKFVWMSIPSDEFLTVSYKVKGGSGNITSDLQKMEGNFSYLDKNESKTVAIVGSEGGEGMMATGENPDNAIPSNNAEMKTGTGNEDATGSASDANTTNQVNTDNVASTSEEAKNNEESVAVNTPEPTKVETALAPQPKVPEPKPAQKTENTASTSNAVAKVPQPETGIAYKVQILAGHNVVNDEFVKKKYNFSESFVIDNHEGWVKYITGSYPEYKQARDKREALVAENHNFPGPFVTAYNAGQRITVQEALMITNQKWIK